MAKRGRKRGRRSDPRVAALNAMGRKGGRKKGKKKGTIPLEVLETRLHRLAPLVARRGGVRYVQA